MRRAGITAGNTTASCVVNTIAAVAAGNITASIATAIAAGAGAATADGQQARRVTLAERRCLQEIPTHRGDADEVGDSFLFDQFERTIRFPLVRHDELGAADERSEHHRYETGHMEQRHAQQLKLT